MNQSLSRKLIVNLFAAFFIALTVTSCSKSGGSNPAPASKTPSISALSVTSGSYNTSVVITGINFSSTITNDQVLFNGKVATITAATSTQLTVTVPLGAGTGAVTLSVNGGTTVTGPVFTYQVVLFESVFAGSTSGAQGLADGSGTSALFNYPNGLAFDAKGNLYVADNRNGAIRKISADGTVSTYSSGNLGGPMCIVFDAAGNLYCTEFGLGTVIKITPAGTVSTFASGFTLPYGIAIDATGNLYVVDQLNDEIKKITPSGTVTVIAGNTSSGAGGSTTPVNGPGTVATFLLPSGIAVDASGNVYVADTHDDMIRKITPAGVVSTFAGSGVTGAADGPGSSATFSAPTGIAVDASGNVYVTDNNNQLVRKITAAGTVTTIAGMEGRYGITKDGLASSIYFDYPTGIAVDANGSVYVSGSAVISKISME